MSRGAASPRQLPSLVAADMDDNTLVAAIAESRLA
jgi:hypothetical protein